MKPASQLADVADVRVEPDVAPSAPRVVAGGVDPRGVCLRVEPIHLHALAVCHKYRVDRASWPVGRTYVTRSKCGPNGWAGDRARRFERRIERTPQAAPVLLGNRHAGGVQCGDRRADIGHSQSRTSAERRVVPAPDEGVR